MINKKIIALSPQSMKNVMLNVLFQWLALLCNIGMIYLMTQVVVAVYQKQFGFADKFIYIGVLVLLKAGLLFLANRQGYYASENIKITLRAKIYDKIVRLGHRLSSQVKTSEIVQMTVEGVDQLEIYFSSYLPQFFYALLVPLTLFVIILPFSFISAIVLLIGVPLIPISIALVQTFAKKLLSKYWGQYTALGDTFLENLQGLTTLKIYQADQARHNVMNQEAEKFRKVTMKVLTMQLNSITIMDLVAYGGVAVGAVLAIRQLQAGAINFQQALIILLLAPDFFIPMRLLGSFFHIAMNGVAAIGKINHLLQLDEPEAKRKISNGNDIVFEQVSFSYSDDTTVLTDINLKIMPNQLTAIIGESGCGKSTIAKLMMGYYDHYDGEITIGDVAVKEINRDFLMQQITYVSFDNYLFQGSLKENLLLANSQASEQQLWSVLKQVRIDEFVKSNGGLDLLIASGGSNLSGGQRQRIAIARALLHDSPIYLFDEATSNIDVESENELLKVIYDLASYKTVVMITHRLKNVENASHIYVMDQGQVVGAGTNKVLLAENKIYQKYYAIQHELESISQRGHYEFN